MRHPLRFGASSLLIAVAALIGCSEDKTTTPDTTAPTVSITAPSAGAVVRDSVIITATATDNRGLAAVDFFVDGDSLATDTRKPYQAVWRLAGEAFGPHQIRCRARDTSQHETLSEAVTVTVSDVIFTANFTDDWLLATEGTGLLFISTLDGVVLAETTWVGNRSLDVRPLPGVTLVPERVAVTVVTRDASGEHVSLVTNRGVAPSAWTWRGHERPEFGDTPAEITLSFEPVPSNIGYVVSSPWADVQDYTTGLPAQMGFPLHDQSNDLLVVYGTHSGSPRYKWFPDITTGGTGQYAANLSGAATAGQKAVALPGSNAAHVARLYGFPQAGHHDAGAYLLSVTGSASGAAQALLYYPSGISDFLSWIRVDESASGESYWSEARTGSIQSLASAFTAVDVGLGFLGEEPDDFDVLIIGEADQIRSCWQASAGTAAARWFVYGARADWKYALPALPESFAAHFGELTAMDFGLRYAEVIDYPQLDTYEEIIARTFRDLEPFGDTIHTARLKGRWASSLAPGDPAAHHNNARDAFGGRR